MFGVKFQMVFIVFLDCVGAQNFFFYFSGFPLLWVIDCSQITTTTHTLSTCRVARRGRPYLGNLGKYSLFILSPLATYLFVSDECCLLRA